jgi:hypothetical protein
MKEKETVGFSKNPALQINLYFKLLDVLDSGAQNYGLWLKKKYPERCVEENKQLGRIALEELYFAQGDKDKIQIFKKDWGDHSSFFEGQLKSLDPKIESLKEELNAPKYNILEKFRQILNASKKINSLSGEQWEKLFQIAGYSKEEAVMLCKKIALSTSLTAGEISLYTIGGYYGLGWGLTQPFLGDITQANTQAILGLTFLAKFGSMYVNSREQIKLLKDKDIQTSPSVLVTGTYFLSRKVFSNKENLQDLTTLATANIPPLGNDILFFATSLLAPSVTAATNIVHTGLNLTLAAGCRVWLETKGKKSERMQAAI